MNSNINAKSSIANPNDDVVDTVNAARPSSPPRVAVADGDGVSAADEDPPLPQAMSHLHANHQRASVPFLLHPSVPSGCFTNANVMVEVRDDNRLHLQQHLVAPHPRDATQATGGLRFAPPEIPRAVEGMLRRPISPFCPPPCFNMKYRYFIPEADIAAVAAAAPFDQWIKCAVRASCRPRRALLVGVSPGRQSEKARTEGEEEDDVGNED